MSKLLMLSEINCWEYLNTKGVYPDEFYTDFVMFRNRASTFVDADIIILIAGSCRFSKRHVLNLAKVLQKRADDPNDNGVRSLTVITDLFLPSIDRYYKFQGKIPNISEYHGWKLRVKNSDILSRVSKGNKNTDIKLFLTPYDEGNVEHLRDKYKSLDSPDEELRSLIKKPSFEINQDNE